MNQITIIAALSLALVSVGACDAVISNRTPSAAATDVGGDSISGLIVGAPAGGAAIGTVPDDATGAPHSQNRMHISQPRGTD